jgi:hypothetical protein
MLWIGSGDFRGMADRYNWPTIASQVLQVYRETLAE